MTRTNTIITFTASAAAMILSASALGDLSYSAAILSAESNCFAGGDRDEIQSKGYAVWRHAGQ